MPHWAEIDEDNKVLRVTYGEGTDEESYRWLLDNLGGTWVRTYYSTPGKTYAGTGYIYNTTTGDFDAPIAIIPAPDSPGEPADRPVELPEAEPVPQPEIEHSEAAMEPEQLPPPHPHPETQETP